MLIKESPVFSVTLMGGFSEWFSGTNNRFYSQLSDSCFVFIKENKRSLEGLRACRCGRSLTREHLAADSGAGLQVMTLSQFLSGPEDGEDGMPDRCARTDMSTTTMLHRMHLQTMVCALQRR